jgi:NhaP-type Na+/H+ or K+/H+ antiporter
MIIAIGGVILLTAWLPLIVRGLPLSLPIVAVAIGYFLLPDEWLARMFRVIGTGHTLEHLAELVILVALMGAGVRIKRAFSWREWSPIWRLLGIAMPLTVAAVAVLGHFVVGIGWAAALVLGAVLAPTDPVLAADVQVRSPGHEEGGEVRFNLTSEAGFNDGLASPLVLLAMAAAGTFSVQALTHWLAIDLVWKTGSGLAIGYGAGRLFGWLTFKMPRLKLSKTGDGLVALGMTLISYGAAEVVDGNGFIAVFVAAITLRSTDRGHDFHAALAEFSEQIERVLMVGILIIFGASIASGLLGNIGWRDVTAALLTILVIRPVAGWISLIGVDLPPLAPALIAFFGIRGLGTIYYLLYVTGRTQLPDADRLWALTSLVVLLSIIVHGIASTPLMNWVDRRRAEASGKTGPD